MERLTVPDEKIEGGWKRSRVDPRYIKTNMHKIYWALKEYEDTGLAPPEVRELKERDTAKAPLPSMAGLICPICGERAAFVDRFCGNCGQRFEED